MTSSRSTPIASQRPSSPAEPTPLDGPAQFLKGVGPRRAEALARLGVHTVRDLLLHVPRRYEDASTVTRVRDLRVGTDATVIGVITSKGVVKARTGLRIFQVLLNDGTGTVECSWPGQPFLDRTLHRGDRILVTGPVRVFHGRQIQPREFVVLDRAGEEQSAAGRVLPIYPATEGLSQRVLRSILEANLDRYLPLLVPEEPFTPEHLDTVGVPSLMKAVTTMHRPGSVAEAERGRRRLAYEELFFHQLLHARVRLREATRRRGIAFRRDESILAPLYRSLPFTLTKAQTDAIREILTDMAAERRMNRLLQGDVGSDRARRSSHCSRWRSPPRAGSSPRSWRRRRSWRSSTRARCARSWGSCRCPSRCSPDA